MNELLSQFPNLCVTLPERQEANINSLDDRMITADQLRAKVYENNIL
jgi:hypothetical protein